jgi:hypothetical protein
MTKTPSLELIALQEKFNTLAMNMENAGGFFGAIERSDLILPEYRAQAKSIADSIDTYYPALEELSMPLNDGEGELKITYPLEIQYARNLKPFMPTQISMWRFMQETNDVLEFPSQVQSLANGARTPGESVDSIIETYRTALINESFAALR